MPDRAAEAVRSFFRRGNLLALRELALRRTAEHVDADVQDYRRDHEIEPTWPVAERILVCVRPNPESDRLVRAARRMAARHEGRADRGLRGEPGPARALGGGAAGPGPHHEAGGGAGGGHRGSLRRERQRHAALVRAPSATSAASWSAGPPTRSWRDRLKGSLLDDIVRGSGGIEVHVIAGRSRQGSRARRGPARAPRRRGDALRLVRGGGGRLHARVLGDVRALRQVEPRHGLPSRRGLRGHASTAGGPRRSPRC